MEFVRRIGEGEIMDARVNLLHNPPGWFRIAFCVPWRQREWQRDWHREQQWRGAAVGAVRLEFHWGWPLLKVKFASWPGPDAEYRNARPA